MTMSLLLNFVTPGIRQDIYERVGGVCVCLFSGLRRNLWVCCIVAGIQVFPKSETRENLFFMDSAD